MKPIIAYNGKHDNDGDIIGYKNDAVQDYYEPTTNQAEI